MRHLLITAVDQTGNYFSKIGQSFMADSFRSQASLQVITILGIVVLVLIGVIVFLWFYAKKNKQYIPHGWQLDPSTITHTLTDARNQRSKFELNFHAAKERRRSTSCNAIDIENGNITMECSGLTNISNAWIGKMVDCYFRVVDEQRTPVFYMFSSAITGIRPVGNEISHITIAVPDKLEQKQKRASLRVSPPTEYVLGLAVWPAQILANGNVNLDIKQWGKPRLAFVPGKREEVRLDNVSAGGLKLHIDRQNAKKCEMQFNIADQLMLLVDLWEPETGQRLRYWLLCRIQSPYVDFETRNVELGLQFIRRLELQANSNHMLQWSPMLSPNEVEEIGNWAMRRHLELYREKGLE